MNSAVKKWLAVDLKKPQNLFLILIIIGLSCFSFSNIKRTPALADPNTNKKSIPSERMEHPSDVNAHVKTEKLITEEKYPEIASLPTHFSGSDIEYAFEELFRTIIQLGPKSVKSQYETESEFKIRLKIDTEEIIRANRKLENLTDDFVLFTEEPMPMEIAYNAERKAFDFDYPLVGKPTIFTKTKKEALIGENSFGVQREIEKITYSFFNLNLLNKRDIKEESDIIPMIPDEARKHGENLRFLYIVKLEHPFISDPLADEPLRKPATLDHPKETISNSYSLIANLHGMAIFNYQTGEVLFHKRFIE